jgi:hypothetical protein
MALGRYVRRDLGGATHIAIDITHRFGNQRKMGVVRVVCVARPDSKGIRSKSSRVLAHWPQLLPTRVVPGLSPMPGVKAFLAYASMVIFVMVILRPADPTPTPLLSRPKPLQQTPKQRKSPDLPGFPTDIDFLLLNPLKPWYEHNRGIEHAVASTLRVNINERKRAWRERGQRPRGGIHEAAVEGEASLPRRLTDSVRQLVEPRARRSSCRRTRARVHDSDGGANG